MTGKRAAQGGFTLIELVITVSIVAILARMSFVVYTQYAMKADRADAKVALTTYAQILERCYSQNFYYYNATASLDCPGYSSTSPNGFYTISATTRTATAYTLTATPAAGKITAKDTQCTTLTLNNLGVKGSTGTGTTNTCWGSN